MKLEDAQAVADASGGDVEVRERYSGRGMYGRETAGVVGPRRAILKAAFAADVDAGNFEWDSMGLDEIAY